MDIVLSEGQAVAVDMVGRFLGQDEHRVGIITGYAGTGKTTLIRVLDEAYGTPIVLTPTGKAALRVSEATGLQASTIHRFLYKAADDPETGEPIFVMREASEINALVDGAFILVDEASMVDQKVWGDLNAAAQLADVKLLLMGDRFQLPPVSKPVPGGAKVFCALDWTTPFSVNLTEVVRQALDSPIIRASMDLRSGKPEFMAMGLLNPVGASKLVQSVIELRERGGTVIVHRNKTRHDLNQRVRGVLGFEPGTIEAGEPLLVTQNNYSLNRYNGEVVTFDGWAYQPTERTTEAVLDRFTQGVMDMGFGMGTLDSGLAMLSPDEVAGKSEELKIGVKFIKKAAKRVFRAHIAADEEDPAPPHLHANYGYALTCHKSQGSEWPEVLVVMEGSLQAMGPIERKRWLYTAITRAKQKVSYLYLKD